MFTEDCPFKVVRTNGGDEVLVRAASLLIGRAAFESIPPTETALRNWGTRLSVWL
jgi:hypothetical protein